MTNVTQEPVLSIRTAAKTETALISALATTTFYEAYHQQDEAGDLASYILESFSPDKIRSEIDDPDCTFFIAEINGKAVGYAKLRENSTTDCMTGVNAVELQRVYVLYQAKGKGVGKALIERCCAAGREKGYDALWLGVWSQNIPAQKVYDRLGFTRAGELRFPYGDQLETNFVLVKEL